MKTDFSQHYSFQELIVGSLVVRAFIDKYRANFYSSSIEPNLVYRVVIGVLGQKTLTRLDNGYETVPEAWNNTGWRFYAVFGDPRSIWIKDGILDTDLYMQTGVHKDLDSPPKELVLTDLGKGEVVRCLDTSISNECFLVVNDGLIRGVHNKLLYITGEHRFSHVGLGSILQSEFRRVEASITVGA